MVDGQKRTEDAVLMFQALDMNGDGFIERDDLRKLLFELGVARDVTAIFHSHDQDHDGKIAISDFVEWLLEDAPAAAQRRLTEMGVGDGSPSLKRSLAAAAAFAQGQKAANCSQWFAEAIADAGVTHVYGGHGGALVPMVNAVVDHPKLTWVPTRNEANASLMAAAHAKLTGGLACCIATSGPGATNLTTGLLEADLDHCSVIAITGLKPRQGLGYSEFQDVNQSQLFAGGGITFSHNVASAEAFVPLLRNGLAKAITAHTCVHLAVPVDIQAAPCPVQFSPFSAMDTLVHIRSQPASAQLLDAVVAELLEATAGGHGRVLIGVGHRCVASGPEILKLAEQLHAPVLTRLDAKGCCDESHPLVWGVMGVHGKPGLDASARLLEKAELVLAFGVHDYTILLCNAAGLQVRPMIQFEPDPASPFAYSTPYQALHTVIGYTPYILKAIIAKLQAATGHANGAMNGFTNGHGLAKDASKDLSGSIQRRNRRNNTKFREWNVSLANSGAEVSREAPWERSPAQESQGERAVVKNVVIEDYWEMLHAARQRGSWAEIMASKDFLHKGRYEVQATGDHMHCHPAKVFEEMNKHLGPDDVLCVDTGDVTLWASLCAVLSKGQRTLSSERLGTMGYSLCAGIVACLVREEHGRGIVVAGDGGIQMTLNELGTAAQVISNSPVPLRLLIIVFDNAMLGRVYFGFEGAKGCELGPSPDFVALARAYGGDGALLQDPQEAPATMAKAFAATGLYLVHALVDPLLKADMTAFKDKSIQMMASG